MKQEKQRLVIFKCANNTGLQSLMLPHIIFFYCGPDDMGENNDLILSAVEWTAFSLVFVIRVLLATKVKV